MHAIEIRRALVDDAPLLSEIAIAAKRAWGYPEPVIQEWLTQLSVAPSLIAAQPTCIAEIDRKAVAFYSVAPAEPYWILDHLWVRPETMRRGIGRRLLLHALATVAEAGAPGLDIDADPNAEQFYLLCGAHRVGATPAPIPGSPDRVRPRLLLVPHTTPLL